MRYWLRYLLLLMAMPALAQGLDKELYKELYKESYKAPSVALEKAYQQVLYEYYQGDFAQALTKMAILEQYFPQGLQQIPDHLSGQSVEPELLKGGMSLSYGLDNQAQEIFSRLLKSSKADDVTAYAWLLLGKTFYQNRQFSAAAQAFEQINVDDADEYFDRPTRDNWLYLQSQLHGFLLDTYPEKSSSVDDIQTTQWLDKLSSNSVYRHYVHYNQSLALLQNGDTQAGIDRLTELVDKEPSFVDRWLGWSGPLFEPNSTEDEIAEIQAIRDRANLTLAYNLLQQGEHRKAYQTFENIRTNGLDGEAALLGYGWAAAKQQDWQIALSIWQRLIQMPQNSEYTLEAYLASAYAYEKAFAPQQSLQMLEQAILRFNQANNILNLAQEKVTQRQFILDLVPSLFSQNITADNAENSNLALQLLNVQGKDLNTTYLFQSISVSNEFRTRLATLADSHKLQQQLEKWQQRMQHYHLMLDERKEERSKRAKDILKNRTLERLQPLMAKREMLANTINTAKQQNQGQILMSTEYQDWLKRVNRAEQGLTKIAQLKAQLDQAPLKKDYARRVARVKGRLIWQASEALPVNLRQAQKLLSDLDKELAEGKQSQQQLLSQLVNTPAFTEQRQRVQQLTERINTQLQNNRQLQDTLITVLSGTFSQFIQQHKTKINHYILQAQLAMVRLNDQALQKEDGDLIEGNGTPQGAVSQGVRSSGVRSQ
jgi:hypothetical protein